MDNQMKFSIIVPSRNEIADIGLTLELLRKISYRNYEVIIVDDSSDGTFELVAQDFPEFTLIKGKGIGLNAAFNQGIIQAVGDVVVLITADTSFPENFLEKIQKHYVDGYDAVVVRSVVSNSEFIFPRYIDKIQEKKFAIKKFVPIWSEAYSCRRAKALEAGLLPVFNFFNIVGGTDNLFASAVRKVALVKVDLDIHMPHIQPADFGTFYQQMYDRGRAASQLINIQPPIRRVPLMLKRLVGALFRYLKILLVLPLILESLKLKKYGKQYPNDFLKMIFASIVVNFSVANGMIGGLKDVRLHKSKVPRND
jgi:glycosyltransferase involved in cell wall biosynthesis